MLIPSCTPPHSSLATLGFVASLPSDAAVRSCRNLFTRGVAIIGGALTLYVYPRPYAAAVSLPDISRTKNKPGGGIHRAP